MSFQRSHADDARADHALAHVLVGRHDAHLVDARIGREARGRGRDRVVGFELDHRPHDEAERRGGALGELELVDEVRVETFAGLVAGEQVVAERLDHVIERDATVRDAPAAEQPPRLRRDARAAPTSRPSCCAGGAPNHARKQLVRAVEQMDLHGAQATGRSCDSHQSAPRPNPAAGCGGSAPA